MMHADRVGPVLIVEDDRNTAALIKTYLEKEGFQTAVVHDGEEALNMIKTSNPGFVILDIMLPKIDGWEVCRRLRSFSDVPVLMLTAREEEIDRVLGLSLGADDYVVKPFSPRELLERVKAILRRARPVQSPKVKLLCKGGLVLDPEKLKVTLHGRIISLTSHEYKLLYALMRSPGRVFSRSELLDHFYQHGEVVVDRVIDVHIGKLRQKIEMDPARPQYIQTVRGFGYRFTDEDGSKSK
ncbi:MAG: response regulator transcription factor [Desulfobulbaceae bacterium]|jgi:DNA-binding response OmpR family regulator|nr:response regulator transcription factor [Desulfobulbaceae bacterium]HKJ15019.1 response regulator transcription factor [Desulfobulbales bacterium]MDH3542246.1 response regulator transcription factor [Desulfobulbaceae bacterium]MDH3775730.1 response regulator transcription factor [Desulfobulbaceae bacterium]MDH3782591.1 response regulator transcription factor [Desulfobulbaceae bacterium]